MVSREKGRAKPGRRVGAMVSVVAMVLAMLAGLGVQQAAAAPGCNPYPDVDASNVHCENISWLRGVGITKPVDGLYRPANKVTRGSMAAFLFRFARPGKASPRCTGKPFPDVATSNVFCGYIQWAVHNGVTKGYPSDGTYRPKNGVTRGAMAAFLQRIANPGSPAKACISKPFRDVATTETFCAVITWMVKNHITYGVDGGTRYGTKQIVNRQSMASFLHRVDDLYALHSIGETVRFFVDGESSANVTVEGIRRVHKPLRTYGSPPTHTYILVDVKVAAFSGIKQSFWGSWSVNPFNWAIQDAKGYHYDPTFVAGVDHGLPAEDLSPGEMVRGTIAFDAPDHGTITLTPPDSDGKFKWSY